MVLGLDPSSIPEFFSVDLFLSDKNKTKQEKQNKTKQTNKKTIELLISCRLPERKWISLEKGSGSLSVN